MTNIVLYVTMGCPFCRRALALLDSKSIKYDAIDLSSDQEKLRAIKQETGHSTVPIILFDNQLIGGYSELAAKDQQGELDKFTQQESASNT